MRAFFIQALAVLFGLSLALSSCSSGSDPADPASPRPQAATLTVLADVSSSTASVVNAAYADRVAEAAGAQFSKMQLGDSARIVVVGDRTADHAAGPPPIVSGYRLRLPVARRKLTEALRAVFAQSRPAGGDHSTNLLFTLENAHPVCTPRSVIFIISDMVEASDNYSATGALASGQPVTLPPPPAGAYRGCTVVVQGLGVAADMGTGVPQILSNAQLAALADGWKRYFVAGGVAASDIHFNSVL